MMRGDMTKPKKGRSDDLNILARSIVGRATGETATEAQERPEVTHGRRGGQKGGRARAESLSAKERSEIAKKAAAARWKK